MSDTSSGTPVDRLDQLERWASRYAEGFFWLLFFLVPLFTGLLAYNWLPNESFNSQFDVPIESHDIDTDDNGGTTTVYDVWQDKRTGHIYRYSDFAEHRQGERSRMAYTWFMYGLLGCVYFAFCQHTLRKRRFTTSFAQAVCVDLAVAAFTYWDHAPGR